MSDFELFNKPPGGVAVAPSPATQPEEVSDFEQFNSAPAVAAPDPVLPEAVSDFEQFNTPAPLEVTFDTPLAVDAPADTDAMFRNVRILRKRIQGFDWRPEHDAVFATLPAKHRIQLAEEMVDASNAHVGYNIGDILSSQNISLDSVMAKEMELVRIRGGFSERVRALAEAGRNYQLKNNLKLDNASDSAAKFNTGLDPLDVGPSILPDQMYRNVYVQASKHAEKLKPLYDLAVKLAKVEEGTPDSETIDTIAAMSDEDYVQFRALLYEAVQDQRLGADPRSLLGILDVRLDRSVGRVVSSVIGTGDKLLSYIGLGDPRRKARKRMEDLTKIQQGADPAITGDGFTDAALNAADMVMPIVMSYVIDKGISGVGMKTVFYSMGVQEIDDALLEAGVDPSVSTPVSLLAGIPYMMIESAQTRRLFPANASLASIRGLISGSIGKTLLSIGKKQTTHLAQQTMEEMLQQGTVSAAVTIGAAIDPNVDILDVVDFAVEFEKVLESGVEAVKTIPFLMLPGAISSIRTDLRDSQGVKVSERAAWLVEQMGFKPQAEALAAEQAGEAVAPEAAVSPEAEKPTPTPSEAVAVEHEAVEPAVDPAPVEAVEAPVEGIEVLRREIPDAKDVGPRTEDERQAADFASAHGIDVVFVETSDEKFQGRRSGNTAFVRSGLSADLVWETVGHEAAHATGMDTLLEEHADDSDIADARQRTLDRATPEYRKVLEKDSERLNREAVALLIGEVMRSPEARARLQKSNPSLFAKIIEAIRRTIASLKGESAFADRVLSEFIDTVEAKAEKPPAQPVAKPSPETSTPVVPPNADVPAGGVTGISIALTEEETEGKPPRTWEDLVEDAKSTIADDPDSPHALLRDIVLEPRPLKDSEVALLNVHKRGIVTAKDKAFKAARNKKLSEAERATATLNYESLQSQLQVMADAHRASNRETARGLSAVAMGLATDYSLSAMVERAIAANKMQDLSPKQMAMVEAQAQRIQALEGKIAELEQKQSDRQGGRSIEKIIKDTRRVFRPKKAAVAKADKVIQEFLSGSTLLDLPQVLNPKLISALGVKILDKIASGIESAGDLIFEVLTEYKVWDAQNGKPEGRKGLRLAQYVRHVLKQKATRDALERVRRGQTVPPSDETIQRLTDATRGGKILTDQHRAIQQMAEAFVAEGITEREALIDAVHAALIVLDPNITRRDAMDAISGYGQWRPLNENEIKATLRDLKGQMQQVGKLQDMESGIAPQKTGNERRVPSNEERQLIQQVNEEKRKGGFTVQDPEAQLKSALDAIKTRLRNQITDLEQQITTGERIVKGKTEVERDAEARALEVRRDALKLEFDSIFGKPDMTDEQRVAIATKALQRSIDDYERRIAEGDLFPEKKQLKTPKSALLSAMRSRRDALRQELQELQAERDVEDPSRLEALGNLAYGRRTANRIAELEEKVASKDFAEPQKRKPLELSPENIRLQNDLARVKDQYDRGVFDLKLKNQTLPEKLLSASAEVFNLPRTFLTSFDLSALGRQGLFIILRHPIIAAKNIPKMLEALLSADKQFDIEQEIKRRKNAPLYKKADLFLSSIGGKLNAQEEAYMSSILNRIPTTRAGEILEFVATPILAPVRASQRAYVTFLDLLRADSFDAMHKSAAVDGKVDIEVDKMNAHWINVATGRGFSVFGPTGSTLFFAPRLVSSRFQLILGEPLFRAIFSDLKHKNQFRATKIIAREYAQLMTTVLTIFGLISLGLDDDEQIEFDPTSSDFAKLRVGDTRVDLLAGAGQVITLLARMYYGHRKNSRGQLVPLTGDDIPYRGDTKFDIQKRFLRTKLSPVAGAIANMFANFEDLGGNPVTPLSTTLNLTVPLVMQDLYEAIQDLGIPKGTAMGLLAFFGFGLNTYTDNPSTTLPEAGRRRRRTRRRTRRRRRG